jgi:trehalose 6-phosphate phosphatase
MPRPAAGWAAPAALARAFARPAAVALFLDVDGTLLHIADTPDAVTIGRDTVALLRRCHAATGGALALITGRRIADVDRLFAPLALPVAGQHGLERRDAAGGLHRYADTSAELAALRPALDEFAAARPGVLVEDKGLSIAVHYRLAPDTERDLATLAERLVARPASALVIQPGKMVLELRPAVRDKGTAIAEFMAEPPFRGRTPVFLGDDTTDEFGFGVVNGLGGLTVKVGAGPSEARLRLAGVDAARAALGRLASAAAPQDRGEAGGG